jgi:Lon protease-like protein
VLESKKTFGIPSYVNNKLEYGTEVELVKVEKEYEDGRLDVMTVGKRIFKVVEFINPIPEKLYAGGNVSFQENLEIFDSFVQAEMIQWIKALYQALNLTEIEIPRELTSFDIAHKIGLSQQEEYDLIKINSELKRQQFILDHLKKVVPTIQNIETTKDRIKMNGHFKFLDPLNF